jgi:hypothetical protein
MPTVLVATKASPSTMRTRARGMLASRKMASGAGEVLISVVIAANLRRLGHMCVAQGGYGRVHSRQACK